MRITRIKVENFRSIKSADIKVSEFNIFVGQNNHGKTNLFEAIEWFYSGTGDLGRIVFQQNQKLDVSVELEFTDVQAGIEAVRNEKNRESFRKFADGRDVIQVIRRKSDGGKRLLWLDEQQGWSTKNFAGFDKAFNDCIPRLEYVSTATKLSDISKYAKKTPIGLMLSGVLTAILETSQKYQSFQQKFEEVFGASDSDVRAKLDELSGRVKLHLEQQFPDCTSVFFEVSEPAFDDILKNFETTINDGIETKAEEKGDGMQRALMLAIIKTYSDFRREHDELGKNFIFLIDEAELHLHPTAQRQLKDALLTLSQNGDQVLINTHSSVLVADDHPEQTLFKVEKNGGVTEIIPISSQEKSDIVYELLGGSPADLLLPNNFLIVEGRSELELITRVIKRHYPNSPKIQIIIAEGDSAKQRRSMDSINVAFTPLNQTPVYKEKIVILCDKPNQQQETDFNLFLNSYPHLQENGQLLVSDYKSLEESYPSLWRKTAAEVAAMQAKEKTELAKAVGDSIDKGIFEEEMPIVYQALSYAWEKAYR